MVLQLGIAQYAATPIEVTEKRKGKTVKEKGWRLEFIGNVDGIETPFFNPNGNKKIIFELSASRLKFMEAMGQTQIEWI